MTDTSKTADSKEIEDMWCPNPAAYDRGECCGKCPEFVRNFEAYAAAMREAGEWLAKVKR